MKMASTARGALVHAQRNLENAGARILGVVLHKMSAQRDGYYGSCKNSKYHAECWNTLLS